MIDSVVITANKITKSFSSDADPSQTTVRGWVSLGGTTSTPFVVVNRFPSIDADPADDFVDLDAAAEVAVKRSSAAGRLPKVMERVGQMLYGNDLPSLKALRLKSGLSQEQFAEKMKTSQATVSKWERGLIDARHSTMGKIAEVLGVNVGLVAEVWCRSCKPEDAGNV